MQRKYVTVFESVGLTYRNMTIFHVISMLRMPDEQHWNMRACFFTNHLREPAHRPKARLDYTILY